MHNKMFAVITVLAIALSIFLAGCAGPGGATGQKDSVTVLLDAIRKSKSITSSETAYDVVISTGSVSIKMRTEIWARENISRADISGSLLGVPIIIRSYYLLDGSFLCSEAQGNWTCEEGEERYAGFVRPLDMGGEEMVMQMISSGALVPQPGVTEKSYVGRKCDDINILINMTKLYAMQGSELGEIMSSERNVTAATLEQCFDQETGYTLYFKMSMDVPSLTGAETQKVEFEMSATRYIPNPTIPDSIFMLPAEVAG